MATPGDHGRALAVMEEVEDWLLEMPGVSGVALGQKVCNGRPTSEVCIVVYVEDKLPLHQVPDDQVIPASFRGVPTDVVAAGR